MSRSVVVAGGGTGGHIFPGLAVVRELQALGAEPHWLGARRGLEAELVGQRGVPLTLVDLEGFHGLGPGAVAKAMGLMPQAIAASMRMMLRLEPTAVLGVGGYASGAGVAAAGLLGVPYVLQEQNSVPGLTNRFLAPWAALVCCGFADAVDAFPSMPAEWTGNPVRDSFFEIAEVEVHDPPKLLILGGSQGSLFLNRTLPRALAILAERGMTPEIRHQAGVRWADVVRTTYQDLSLEAEVAAFLSEPWGALADADLVVARSGALTVSELSAAGRGSVLIPFGAAAGNHQLYNAESLARAGGAVVLTEAEAAPERVAHVLEGLLQYPETLRVMGECARQVAQPDAASKIAARVLSVGAGL
jgi:UDP-N-acetylglucosamine--N-acetylmuramyl-(pentapeptide) pyrophosphoryl-undecaprenol N-acetylglucosamine transferase